MGHRLTERDVEAMTATCAKCGVGVKIARNGKRGFVCVVARREAKRRWRQAHPERARQDRRRPVSKHRLEKRDGSADSCKVCGPVQPVAMGRGWGCPNRAKELGWKDLPESPQPRCLSCHTFLDRLGGCPNCDMDLDDLYMPKESRRYPSSWQLDDDDWKDDFYSVVRKDSALSDGVESAVPGWKTLGSLEPFRGVKPEYARLYGAGSK